MVVQSLHVPESVLQIGDWEIIIPFENLFNFFHGPILILGNM